MRLTFARGAAALLGVAMLAIAGAAGATDAEATLPGENGKIVFTRGNGQESEIWLMNPDGSDAQNLTNNGDGDITPAWSPDGTKLAFSSDRISNLEIWVMNADGSDAEQLTEDVFLDCCVRWSPDGSKLLFHSDRAESVDVWVMDAEGSNQTYLTANPATDGFPDWSPDGTRIVFSSDRSGEGRRLFVMNADGSGVAPLGTGTGHHPNWSPDGTRVAFDRQSVDLGDGRFASDIFVINTDGTGERQLTTIASAAGDSAGNPSWSPDGTKILFDLATADGGAAVYQMNADGSDQAVVSQGGVDYDADWQPLTDTAVSPTPGTTNGGGDDNSMVWIIAGVAAAVAVFVVAGGAFAVMGRRT